MQPVGALVDLGATVSLMPLSIAKQLSFEVKPSRKTILLADRSVRIPHGEFEDIPIQIGHVIVPCDFVIMDMEEDPQTPLILGWDALKTLGMTINCKTDTVILEVAGEKLKFEFSKIAKKPLMEQVRRIDVLDEVVAEFEGWCPTQDPLLTCQILGNDTEVEMIEETMELFDSAPEGGEEENVQFVAEVREATDGKEERTTPPPQVEMKPLPSSLKYAFLDSDEAYPVIVNAKLSGQELEKLLDVLRQHRSAIGYTIDDIRGISPSLCMHRIFLNDSDASSIEPQRRLNPNMKEVVKKEILKLLDAGIIYPISDSKWVSPVHVVPKKGGVTIVKNDKGEDISTRTVTGWRMCIDYRKLNKSTWKDHFPLPFIDQMLERLAGHQYFCFLDGYSVFFQIPIHPDD